MCLSCAAISTYNNPHIRFVDMIVSVVLKFDFKMAVGTALLTFLDNFIFLIPLVEAECCAHYTDDKLAWRGCTAEVANDRGLLRKLCLNLLIEIVPFCKNLNCCYMIGCSGTQMIYVVNAVWCWTLLTIKLTSPYYYRRDFSH